MKLLNLSLSNKSISKIIILLVVFIITLSIVALFPVTGDDWYYQGSINWLSWKSVINSTVKYWQHLNGRVLGNLAASTLCKTDVFNTLIRTGVIFGIALLTFLNSGFKSSFGVFVSYIYVMSIPAEFFRQTYSWSAGFYNYVPPVFLLLFFIYLVKNLFKGEKIKENVWRILGCLVLGISSQLFIENITVFNILLSIILIVWYSIEHRKISVSLLTYLFGCIAGALIMFLSPVYMSVADGADSYRKMGTGLNGLILMAKGNYFKYSTYTIGKNYMLIFSIAIICTVILLKSGVHKNNKIELLRKINICILSILPAYFLIPEKNNKYIDVIACSLFFAATASTVFFFVQDRQRKSLALLFLLAAPIVGMPLWFVSPIGPRCFYAAYIFLVIATVNLISYVLNNSDIDIRAFKHIPVMLFICVCSYYLFIFAKIAYTEDLRINHIKEQMENNETVITLPEFPYSNYLHDSSSQKIGVYFYYEKANDIQFKYIPLKEWRAKNID